MIPEKNINESKNPEKEKVGTFDFFNIEHFLSKIIKNWYWFLILGFLGYVTAYIYNNYYAQRIYASSTTVSISNNSSSYFTPNQSINFIWGNSSNQENLFLKISFLLFLR
jgi:capsular polysaccharide biosynthesis protein